MYFEHLKLQVNSKFWKDNPKILIKCTWHKLELKKTHMIMEILISIDYA